MEELGVLFILENMAFVGIGVFVLVGRALRGRKERRQDAEQTRAVDASGQHQVADLREEMTQMREMMADIVLTLDQDRLPPKL